MHLSCGDSFYEEGEDKMPIIFPREGNLIQWVFSMQQLLVFVRSENSRAAKAAEATSEGGWLKVAKRVKVSCAHQTADVDGEEILAALEKFASRAFHGDVPSKKQEPFYLWRDSGDDVQFSLRAPYSLMEQARRFFDIDVEDYK